MPMLFGHLVGCSVRVGEDSEAVMVRPPCRIESGDLGRDYEDGFLKRGRSQKGNRSREASRDKVDDKRRLHKSGRDLESSETLTRDLETYRVRGN